MHSYVSSVLVILSCLSCAVSGFFPSVSRGAVTCEDPIIPNSRHTPTAWFTWKHPVFAVLTFVCAEKYELQGPKTARCQLTGEWTELPSCVLPPGVAKPIFCDIPAVGDNVDIEPRKMKYKVEESMKVACPRARKSGSVMVTVCGSDGQFYPALPKCSQPRCIPPEIPSDGRLNPNKPSYAVGEVVNYECAEGFRLAGNESTECGADGYFPWTGTKCEQIKLNQEACLRPMTGRKQVVFPDQEEYLSGASITFSCGDGFKLTGPSVLECGSGGEWSDNTPVCRRVLCNRPKAPKGGRLVKGKLARFFFPGQSVKFDCNDGFNMAGSPSCTCGRDGKFHPKAPTCLPSSGPFRYMPYQF